MGIEEEIPDWIEYFKRRNRVMTGNEKNGKTDDIEVIKQMLQKGRKKLKAARINFENECYEDSVSRAYYAVFHTISAVLMSKKLHFSSHKETIGAFNKEFVKTSVFPKTFTKTIQKLFLERQTSDYDIGGYIGPDIAEEDLEKVKEIIEASEKYLAELYNVSIQYLRKKTS
jgi:uncharacterized protein (UPF0332 family)